MDLTGANTNCSESGRYFRIFKSGQILDFGTPVYAESLHVYYASGGLSGQELVKDTDYTITEDNMDYNSMSDAKLVSSDFNSTLINSITFITVGDNSEEFTVSVSYQKLYPSQVRNAYYSAERLDLTPELLSDIVTSLENLKVRTSKVTDIMDLTDTDGVIYDLDTTKTNRNNVVTNESHVVNVPAGNSCILPNVGSFYFDSVVVTYPATGATLVEGKDYVILGMDESATKATSSTSPVFKFIVILASINGEVLINYHAFGGIPTIGNYRDLAKNINNLVSYINSSKNLTEDNLSGAAVISSLIERLGDMETRMRRLEGSPSYGDITSGNTTLMKLFSDVAGMHWYTIASLYQTSGTNMHECTADTFTFRLQSQLSHFQFKVAVSVDLNNTEGDRLHVDVISDNYKRGFVPFKDYSEVAKIIRPQLRVVWNSNESATGAYLQLGFALTNMLEETICIEDMSGHESCWKLVSEIATATTPADSDITLPDGTSIWSDLTPGVSLVESQLIPFSKGTLAWYGEQSLNRPVDGWQTVTLDNILLESSIDISRLSKLRLDLEEVNGRTFIADINFNPGSDHLVGRCSFSYLSMPAYINAEIYYNSTGGISIKLDYDIESGISSNELKIRDITVF